MIFINTNNISTLQPYVFSSFHSYTKFIIPKCIASVYESIQTVITIQNLFKKFVTHI